MTLIASESTDIAAAPDAVWGVITDIANAGTVISGIKQVEVIEPAPGPGIVGLKWRETRAFMGKDAVETMWITAAEQPVFYEVRAESHGSVYTSRMTLEPAGTGTVLAMAFDCQPTTTGAKVMWLLTGWMAKGAMAKTIAQDLADIKAAVEAAG